MSRQEVPWNKVDLISEALKSGKNFSFEDFHQRWLGARLSALALALNYSNSKKTLEMKYEYKNQYKYEDEIKLLYQLSPENREVALKLVFDHGRKFGGSVVRYLRLTWEINDIVDALALVKNPCMLGDWVKTPTGMKLIRRGCEQEKSLRYYLCDYWREAIDGLVMGIGQTERYARHSSVRHGDSLCIDVFYDDSLDIHGKQSKFAEVPENVALGLKPLCEHLDKQNISLTLKGISEGVLFFELVSRDQPLCGSSNRSVQLLLKKEVQTKFPGLELKDASPLAVYGEGT